ncbi:MAG: hypothetical protein KDB27_20205 [Planctomycetales bacterium]|nr:hypothetical protein [Planctomycetales bacterium]
MNRLCLRKPIACLATAFALLFSHSYAIGADPIVIDFEDENFDEWTFIDEDPENLGDQGPSSWDIFESILGFEDNVLTQGSNIWGGPNDHMLMGTIAYYNVQKFTNFRLEVDVITDDNDGMGLVWGYEDLDQHYRFQMMNDRWPDVPSLDGFNGPYLISHKRISNEEPWYEVMEVIESDEYIPYTQGIEEINHWILEVVDGAFTITTIDSFGDENVLKGFDDEYKSGYVGIQLYAQSGIEFDNFTITPLDATLPGDFDADGALSGVDLDLLTAASIAANNPAEFDLNNDNLVNNADRTVWIKDLFNTWIGDSNLDGEFNSSDFVTVFTAGLYETGQPATWGQGDWNGDGTFGSTDFVVAFSHAGYEQGPRPEQVPEPSGMLAVFATIGSLVAGRRRLSSR